MYNYSISKQPVLLGQYIGMWWVYLPISIPKPLSLLANEDFQWDRHFAHFAFDHTIYKFLSLTLIVVTVLIFTFNADHLTNYVSVSKRYNVVQKWDNVGMVDPTRATVKQVFEPRNDIDDPSWIYLATVNRAWNKIEWYHHVVLFLFANCMLTGISLLIKVLITILWSQNALSTLIPKCWYYILMSK